MSFSRSVRWADQREHGRHQLIGSGAAMNEVSTSSRSLAGAVIRDGVEGKTGRAYRFKPRGVTPAFMRRPRSSRRVMFTSIFRT